MRNGLSLVLALAAALLMGDGCTARPAAAQTPDSTTQWLDFIPEVVNPARAFLNAAWVQDDPWQIERAYCGMTRVTFDRTAHALRLQLFDLIPAVVTNPTPVAIDDIECPPGYVIIHTHPPSDCDKALTNCKLTFLRQLPGNCRPSDLDSDSLHRWFWDAPYMLVQCGRDVFTFVFADTPPEPAMAELFTRAFTPPDGTTVTP